jgi:hypothetical protein
MHDYPLHGYVTAVCECCKLSCEIWFTSKDDDVVCKGCRKHHGGGDGPARVGWRNREHVGLYWSELQLAQDELAQARQEHAAEVQRLEDRHSQRVEQMEAELAKQRVDIADLWASIRDGELNPAVRQWMSDVEVTEALEKRDRAYRWRDLAFGALWGVAQLHRPDPHDERLCTCTRKVLKCRELQAIAREIGALDAWEDKQIERLRDSKEHGLPWEHPDVQRLGGGHLKRRFTS